MEPDPPAPWGDKKEFFLLVDAKKKLARQILVKNVGAEKKNVGERFVAEIFVGPSSRGARDFGRFRPEPEWGGSGRERSRSPDAGQKSKKSLKINVFKLIFFK